MFSTIILLISGVLGLFWASKARNQFTKFCSFLIAIALITLVIPHQIARSYGPYFFAFASLMAAFEPSGSRRLGKPQKLLFGIAGIVFAAVAVDRVLIWPIDLQLWPLVLIFFVVFTLMASKGLKKLKTRLGVLLVWLGLGIEHLLRVI